MSGGNGVSIRGRRPSSRHIRSERRPGVWRWLRFNAVGAFGVGVQLASMALLIEAAHLHYLAATGIAVEAAILHNFFWHQRWTWKDRPGASGAEVVGRLVRFHVLNGSVSLIGNFALVAALTGGLGVPAVASSAIAIVICSLVNFLVSEVLVFSAS